MVDMRKKYRLDDGFNGDKWKFDTAEELKKFADFYSKICEGDWMPIYRVLDQTMGRYRALTINEEKELELPHC